MQQQNYFQLFATDPIPSSHDQNDHQNIENLHHLHTNTGDVDGIFITDNINNNSSNNNSSNNNNNSDSNNNSHNLTDNANHCLVPSFLPDSNDNLNFDSYEGDSLFSNWSFSDNANKNDLESNDFDEDKHFNPIPPSPFVYEDDATNRSYSHDNTVSFLSKPGIEDDDDNNVVEMSNYFPMGEEFYDLNLLELEDFEHFDGLERGVDNRFQRSESFASSVISEQNNDTVSDGFHFLGDTKVASENFPAIEEEGPWQRGNTDQGRRVSEINHIHAMDQQGQSSTYDMNFNRTTECQDAYYNFPIDEQSHHFVASSRKRIASGDNGFNKGFNNIPLEQEPLHEVILSQRKRGASGDVGSGTSLKIPRRCTSLGNERFASTSSLQPHSQQDIINRSLPTVLSSSFSATKSIHENEANSLMYNQRGLARDESSNVDVNHNWMSHQDKQHDNDFRALAVSPNSHFPTPIAFTNLDPRNECPGIQYLTSTPSSNPTNNELLGNNQPQPLDNENTRSSHVIAIPSQSSSFSPFIPLFPKAADQECNDSHPFTVRPSSATQVYNNEITSPTAFSNAFSNTNDTSLPEMFPTSQTEQKRSENLAGSLMIDVTHFTEQPVQTANMYCGRFTQNNSDVTSWNINAHNFFPADDTSNASVKFSPHKPKTHGYVYTVPDMVHDTDTIGIGFQSGTFVPDPRKINTEENISVVHSENLYVAQKLEDVFDDHLSTPVSIEGQIARSVTIPANPTEHQSPQKASTPAPDRVAQVPTATQTTKPGNQTQHDSCEENDDALALERAYNECLRTGSQTSLIKEELKRKIMYKRCVQGKNEVPSDPPHSPSSNKLTEEEEIKRVRRLEANRLAATKMRNRRKEEQKKLDKTIESLEDKNKELVALVNKLETEKQSLVVGLSFMGICIDTTVGNFNELT